jgi:2-polyprenyl-3-methyl-5-hydroxy-6-metoxy-1,4-benzoquinol methylase
MRACCTISSRRFNVTIEGKLSFIRRGLGSITRAFLHRFPPKLMEQVVGGVAVYYARTLPPDEGLRFLFNLDRRTYHLEGKLAILYGEGVHTKHRHMRYHDFFVQRVERGERVLDVGCGHGELAQDVAARAGAVVFGMDINEKSIAVAKERHAHPDVTYQVGDVLHDLPDDARFDVIILSNVLEHLPARPDFLRQLVERYIPKRLLIRVPCYDRDWRVPLQEELQIDYRLDPTHEIEYTQAVFKEEIEQAGLEIIELQVIWGEIWATIAGFAPEGQS